MDSSVILLEKQANNGGPYSSEQPVEMEAKLERPAEGDGLHGSADSSLPLEKEEQIRLQARRRLEEQLKQYRVKRHQERSTAKSRPSSTLDPELMLHPETLPRASTVSMTKEYSFLRTSVPRGPKLGSLGLPTQSKERKSSKSNRSSRIRSLADYRTEDAEGHVPLDSPSGSLKQNRSSLTSVVSEIRLTPDPDDRLENSSLAGDSISDIDGSEVGLRLDGNESDSSTYSSLSGRGPYGALLNSESRQGASLTVNGQEVPLEAVGQFPSISEVLQAAAAATEHHPNDQEVNGEVRSRRDSISSSCWRMNSATSFGSSRAARQLSSGGSDP